MRHKRDGAASLILLCWLVYACSYLGKLNYAANITPIMAHYGVNHAQAGLVSSYFSVTYAIGQVVNGIFCRRYPLKQVVFGALVVSATINLAVAFAPAFWMIRFLWMVNGFATSLLWPCLVRLLSETLDKKDLGKAVIAMGTTTASGTFAIYGISAGFALFDGFKWVFVLAAAVVLSVAVYWLWVADKKIGGVVRTEEAETPLVKKQERVSPGKALFICVGMLALYGVFTNLVKDGLSGWVPSILKEEYGLGDSLSILLTLTLPMVSMFGSALSVRAQKRIPDFVLLCGVLFGLSGAVLFGVTAGLQAGALIPIFVGFAASCLFMATCNSVITSMFPMFMKGKMNSGMLAGVLNGFCYVGSTLSSYGLGALADHFGWRSVFTVLTASCLGCLVLAVGYWVGKRILKRV